MGVAEQDLDRHVFSVGIARPGHAKGAIVVLP